MWNGRELSSDGEEIEDTRDRLEQEFRELQDRLPKPATLPQRGVSSQTALCPVSARRQRPMSAATDCNPSIETAKNSSRSRPSVSGAWVTSSRFTPGANAFSFSFFLTDETFMPVAFSGRTSAAATNRPATASAWTIALDIRSVR